MRLLVSKRLELGQGQSFAGTTTSCLQASCDRGISVALCSTYHPRLLLCEVFGNADLAVSSILIQGHVQEHFDIKWRCLPTAGSCHAGARGLL